MSSRRGRREVYELVCRRTMKDDYNRQFYRIVSKRAIKENV